MRLTTTVVDQFRRRLAGCLLAGLVVCAASAAPTDPDPRWDGDGTLLPSEATFVHAMLLQTDGAVIVALGHSPARIMRFDGVGRVDQAFGAGGSIAAPIPDPFFASRGAAYQPVSLALRDDGRFDVLWWFSVQVSIHSWGCGLKWIRYLPSGQPDYAFGQDGALDERSCSATGPLELDRAGRGYRIDQGSQCLAEYDTCNSWKWIRVHAADGTLVESLQPFGDWRYVHLKIDARDRVVVGLASPAPDDVRFTVGRLGPGVFGTAGIASVALPGISSLNGVLPLADGRVVAYGSIQTGDRRYQAALARFTADGRPDESFGHDGVVPLTRQAQSAPRVVQVAGDADGRLLVLVDYAGTLVAARLLSNGDPDSTFAEAGLATLTAGTATPGTLAIRPTGEFVFGASVSLPSQAAVFQFRGGELPPPVHTRVAIEYFHAEFGHYFVTANGSEIAILDRPGTLGWTRTGQSFPVYDPAPPPLVPVCRFWSDQSFAPKSSHFYTPYASECGQVKRDPTWLFEGNAFYARLPEGTPGARTCPQGMAALYRAYNDGKGAAPNHRYTTDAATLDAMVAQGWVMEGEAVTRVFACVPVQY